MDHQATMAMQAASSQTHQSVYLPFRDGLILLLSCFIFPPTWDYFVERTGSHAHAIIVAGVIIVVVAVVIDIAERNHAARLGRTTVNLQLVQNKTKS